MAALIICFILYMLEMVAGTIIISRTGLHNQIVQSISKGMHCSAHYADELLLTIGFVFYFGVGCGMSLSVIKLLPDKPSFIIKAIRIACLFYAAISALGILVRIGYMIIMAFRQ